MRRGRARSNPSRGVQYGRTDTVSRRPPRIEVGGLGFLLRGLGKVGYESDLVCLTHNLLKLFRYGWAAASA